MNSAVGNYLKELGAAMVAYVIVLPMSILLVQAHPNSIWRFPIALAPMAPAVFIVAAVVRHLRRLDETQQRIQTEALAFGFVGTAVLTFSYGFLENVGLPHLNWIFVWPIMGILWLVGLVLATRRLR